jgi:hypothetical protein
VAGAADWRTLGTQGDESRPNRRASKLHREAPVCSLNAVIPAEAFPGTPLPVSLPLRRAISRGRPVHAGHGVAARPGAKLRGWRDDTASRARWRDGPLSGDPLRPSAPRGFPVRKPRKSLSGVQGRPRQDPVWRIEASELPRNRGRRPRERGPGQRSACPRPWPSHGSLWSRSGSAACGRSHGEPAWQ